MADIKIPAAQTPRHLGTDRRKPAIARVHLATGTGKILINGRTFDNYFPAEALRFVAAQPLTVTGTADKFDANITVSGGGPNGQAGAVRHSHPAPDLLPQAVYGLPEFYRAQIKTASLIASPGCYPTTILLPAAPLLKPGLV